MAERNPLEIPPVAESRVYTQQESAQAASELQAFKALESRSARRKRAKRRRILIIIALAIFVIGIGTFLLRGFLSPPQKNLPQATDFVYRGDYIDSIRATGNLAAYEQVTITPEVDGTVSELFVSEGDTVELGQPLFTIDNPDLDKAITTAQRGVDSANLNLRSAQAARDDAGSAANRAWADYVATKKAYEDSKLLAPDDPRLERAPTQADVDAAYEMYRKSNSAIEGADIAVDSAYMGITDAQAALDAAIARADKRKVYSPISGLVVVNNIERGTKLSTLAATGQVPMQVADISQMRMTISVNEIDILNVKPGMQAVVNVEALTGYSTDAEVLRVASTSGSGTETYYGGRGGGLVNYEVDLLVKKPDPKLKIGMSAEAEIIVKKIDNVLLVKSMAINDAGDHSYLQVKNEDGTFREVRVKVVASNNSLTAIEGDVRVGDEVLISVGSGKAQPNTGSSVKVIS